MTSRQARTERRAAERKAAKLAYKAGKAAEFVSQPPAPAAPPPQPACTSRAEINRANAQHSTGPRTPSGKVASSRNSLKHGLASGQVVISGEDPIAFQSLLRELLEEHQPARPTEELLIQEMAQSYWLMQRALRLQNECFTADGIDEKRLSLFLRYQTTHHRAFHKALAALMKIKKELDCTPLVIQQNERKTPFAESWLADGGERLQNELGRRSGGELCWRATRQGIAGRKLIPMSGWGRVRLQPERQKGDRDRFPHAWKTHAPLCETGFSVVWLHSNSTGDRYCRAECNRCRL